MRSRGLVDDAHSSMDSRTNLGERGRSLGCGRASLAMLPCPNIPRRLCNISENSNETSQDAACRTKDSKIEQAEQAQ